MDIFIKISILLCLIEAVLIARESSLFIKKGPKSKSATKDQRAITFLTEENSRLKTNVENLTTNLQQAKTELEGISILWTKAVETERDLRKDLHVAQSQLSYLATKVVKSEKARILDKVEPKSSQYWSSSPNREKQLQNEIM